MFDRREGNVPLLTKRVGGGNGIIPLSRITSWHALLAGILFGVVLGMFLSTTLFSWLLSYNKSGQGYVIITFIPWFSFLLHSEYWQDDAGNAALYQRDGRWSPL